MDYVVFGIGMGASLVLLGFGGRMFGPALRYRHSSAEGDVLKAEELVARVAWSRFCSSLGAAIAIGGMLLLAVTGVAMLLRLSDRAATVSVVLAVVAVIVLMALWSWAFVGRFGLYGIVAERQRPVARSTVSYPVEDQDIDHPVPAAANPVVETEDEANRSTGQRPAEQPSTAQQPSLGPQPATNGRQRPHVAPSAPAPDQAQDQRRSSRQRNPEPEAARKPGAALPVEDLTEATPESVSRPDASRSEVINPSDAAALERILNAPEPVTSGDTNATDSSMSETADVAGPVDPREQDSNT